MGGWEPEKAKRVCVCVRGLMRGGVHGGGGGGGFGSRRRARRVRCETASGSPSPTRLCFVHARG